MTEWEDLRVLRGDKEGTSVGASGLPCALEWCPTAIVGMAAVGRIVFGKVEVILAAWQLSRQETHSGDAIMPPEGSQAGRGNLEEPPQ